MRDTKTCAPWHVSVLALSELAEKETRAQGSTAHNIAGQPLAGFCHAEVIAVHNFL